MTTMAHFIDHTLLKPNATKEQVTQIANEAIDNDFFSVCINPVWVPTVAKVLKNKGPKVCTVIGFPLGANDSSTKAYEAKTAVAQGADEVDMVINIGAAKAGDWDTVKNDVAAVVNAVPEETLVKVIIESCLLTDDEIVQACEAAVNGGADYVKTSTGFSSGGATVSAVSLMRETVGPDIGVKASGGIHTHEQAQGFIDAGASRIGSSSGTALLG